MYLVIHAFFITLTLVGMAVAPFLFEEKPEAGAIVLLVSIYVLAAGGHGSLGSRNTSLSLSLPPPFSLQAWGFTFGSWPTPTTRRSLAAQRWLARSKRKVFQEDCMQRANVVLLYMSLCVSLFPLCLYFVPYVLKSVTLLLNVKVPHTVPDIAYVLSRGSNLYVRKPVILETKVCNFGHLCVYVRMFALIAKRSRMVKYKNRNVSYTLSPLRRTRCLVSTNQT